MHDDLNKHNYRIIILIILYVSVSIYLKYHNFNYNIDFLLGLNLYRSVERHNTIGYFTLSYASFLSYNFTFSAQFESNYTKALKLFLEF